jgi:AcrR family transcriptional regulator
MTAETEGSRERSNAQTRAAITRAALELISEQGFEATTLTQIAERASVSRRTVNVWFSSKEDIVLSGTDLHVDLLASTLAEYEGTTIDRVRQWIDLIELPREHPGELEHLRHRVIASDPYLRAAQRGRQHMIEDLVAGAIAREVGLPDRAVAPRALASAILTALIAMQQRFVEQEPSYAADFRGVDDMLRAGLAALRDAC